MSGKPTSVITTDQIHDLWGLGYTIMPRLRDPFDLPKELIPRGMVYQWNPQPGGLKLEPESKDRRKASGAVIADEAVGGWRPVEHKRHPGYFGPWGMTGPIEVMGLWLCERPVALAEKAKEKHVAAVQKQVDDWAEKFGGQLPGSVRVETQTELGKVDSTTSIKLGDPLYDVEQGVAVDGKTKTIETTTAIPRDMTPHIARIFAERDRLYAELQVAWERGGDYHPWQINVLDDYSEAVGLDPGALKGPALNALLMPIAIANIRKQITEEANSGQTS